jgi:2-polyprenyl-3-methyl-5-hydroxy-6-metoxy-1,4-benzoquinol methylase
MTMNATAKLLLVLRRYKHNLMLKLRLVKEDTHYYVHPDYDGTNLDQWILAGIKGFRQWYQPINFGNIQADVTTPPAWKPNPSLNDDYGLGRWNSIIVRNLPEVKNMRILDVGCNVGLYSIELAKMGATEVIGIDRTLEFNHKSNFPPRQDIISQAKFVKRALEIKNKTSYPVHYFGIDFKDYESIKKLGRFDFVLALNVIYHEYENSQAFLNTLSEITNTIVVQTSIGHYWPLSKWANLPKQTEMLIEAGYTNIKIDCPKWSSNPIIVATKIQSENSR